MPLDIVFRLILLIWAITKFDAFIFISHETFFRLYDLPILRFFNKKIIMLYTGSDTRPPYISGIFNDVLNSKQIIKLSQKKSKNIRFVEKYVDNTICHTSSGHFLKKPFVRGMEMGIPFQLKVGNGLIKVEETDQIKIVHAPSRPKQKGTFIFRKLIKKFIDEGYNIDYQELVNRTNDEILNELASCDFVLDQIYSDTPLAGLATEAAHFGKPSIVGSYYTMDELQRDNPDTTLAVSVYSHPDEIEKNIRELLDNKKYREEMGAKAKEFVTHYWAPFVVAEKFLRVVKGDIPLNWLFDPATSLYIDGAGCSKEQTQKCISKLVKEEGIRALLLEHNSTLENKLNN